MPEELAQAAEGDIQIGFRPPTDRDWVDTQEPLWVAVDEHRLMTGADPDTQRRRSKCSWARSWRQAFVSRLSEQVVGAENVMRFKSLDAEVSPMHN